MVIFSEMKKIQNKIDQESDEIKKKEYYSSSEYKMMEKKKKKIGLSRMKTKTVSFPEFLKFHIFFGKFEKYGKFCIENVNFENYF